jgi:hypothetical protein
MLLSVIKRRVCGFTSATEAKKSEGEYWTLYKDLGDDEMLFYNVQTQKHFLLQKMGTGLRKETNTFRESISALEKVATCLR